MWMKSARSTGPSSDFWQKLRDRARIDDVLLRQHARGQAFGRVAGQYRNDGLFEDRAVVELGGHLVHGGARDLAAGVDRALVRVQAGKRGQQRRVDIDEPAL